MSSQEKRTHSDIFPEEIRYSGSGFAERARQLQEFAYREIGAFALFERIAQKTIADGFEPEYRDNPAFHRPNQSCTTVSFSPIELNAEPGVSSDSKQIILQLDQFKKQGEIYRCVPWLLVHDPESLKEFGPAADYAEVAFPRTELEIVTGKNEGGDATNFFDNMFYNGKSAQEMVFDEQASYIQWLQRAAHAVGIPHVSYEIPAQSFLGEISLQ